MIQFFLNDELISVDNINPTKTVLRYLREDQFLTGTKEGCAEGDCGACTIVIAELSNGKAELKSVNACIQFIPTLHGKAIYTVEYLRKQSNNESLHPVQQAMVDKHGSQCGFCTPGFIMSLWNVYNQHQSAGTTPEREEIRSSLSGNLCRCTGYKPILEAADTMFNLPKTPFNKAILQENLKSLQQENSLDYAHKQSRFYSPKTLHELLQLRAKYSEATLLAGGTDIGLWVNKQFRKLNPVIYLGEVAELKTLEQDDRYLKIGAGVTLTQTYQALAPLYPEMNQMWERFASLPIRNVGTLGGNIANGSPIGDSMPALIALETRIVLSSVRGQREIALQDLYLDYMKKDMADDEIVQQINIPLPDPKQQFRCYKLSKRYDSDISAVFAAFAITLKGNTAVKIKIAFGGMAATPKRALACETVITKNVWNEATLKQAMSTLDDDFTPLTDMRASDHNRRQSAKNLLKRFYLETRPQNPLSSQHTDVFSQKYGGVIRGEK